MTEDRTEDWVGLASGLVAGPAREAVETRRVDRDEPLTQAGEAAGATKRGFYRLVKLDYGGLRAHDRQAFSTLDGAEEWRERNERLSLGVTRHAVLPSDVVMVDGQWLGSGQDATRYCYWRRFGGENRPSLDVAPVVASASLVVHAQPSCWVGRLFLGPLGSGRVWSGQEMLRVWDHRICDSAPPGYRGLYAWNLQATQEFESHLDGAGRFVLVPLTSSQRKLWGLSPLAEYAVFGPLGPDAPGVRGFICAPRRAVAVSARQLRELFEADRLRPETERPDIYRPARLSPEGLVALGPDGYTTLEGARRALAAGGRAASEVLAVTHCAGLPADVTRLDGGLFESGRDRIAPGAGSDVAWVDPSGAGVPVVDEEGTGFMLGRSDLIRVAWGMVADSGAEFEGAPAWLYRVFAKIKFEPLTPHVHGVVVKVNRKEVEAWGLPDGTKAVFLLRGRGSGKVTWRCLDGDAFKGLRPEDASSEDRHGTRGQLPVGVDTGAAHGGGEPGAAGSE